ncbi:MAG: endonuclease/exonuclease/phosphatase family protein [Rhodobacteraceae bacterium]|nr:endonuclease/exonuclease/phosphatase family protein [Paracoccaceae bacterium]
MPSANPSWPEPEAGHRLRIATYNIEWFTNLFGDHDVLLDDNEWSSRYKVKRRDQLMAIAKVLKAVDADAIMVIEAPDTGGDRNSVRALQSFAEAFNLRQSRALSGFESHTKQEITLMYDPDKVEVSHAPEGLRANGQQVLHAPRFDSKFRVERAGEAEIYTFSKPPLEVALTHKPSGKALRLIGVHAKSKAVHGEKGEVRALKIAIANREKQLAQCTWLRQRVEDHLARGESLIVLGDFNDGPKYEGHESGFASESWFRQSGVEVVLGSETSPQTHLKDPNARLWLDPMQGWALSSARFYHSKLKWYVNTLLDYVMLSPDIAPTASWRIYHPFDDPECFKNQPLQQALLTASDHFPVCVDLML